MINFNGNIQDNSTVLIENNRGFLYGDSVFETIKVVNDKVLFLEDHYFRLMATMRIFRMEIPMNFTLEYFESQIIKLTSTIPSQSNAYRVRFSVYRVGDGFYLPKSRAIEFVIVAKELSQAIYKIENAAYEVELYKDAYITKQLFSTTKSNNKIIQIAGSIFAHENDYANCLLLNDEKNVVEALQGNVFMKLGNKLITPPIADGCLNGIMRKQVLALANKLEGLEVVEQSISPFDLQKADELFVTNVISGIQPITKYRKKEFTTEIATKLLQRLNAQILLS